MPDPGLDLKGTSGFCFLTLGSRYCVRRGTVLRAPSCDKPQPQGSDATWRREATRKGTEGPGAGLAAS